LHPYPDEALPVRVLTEVSAFLILSFFSAMPGKYKEYNDLNFAKIADEILQFWKEEKIFEKSVSNREGAESFTFL
jgi:hypothetical protein